jgi:uncharacterized linocin/CFP29 family protein
MLDFVVNGQGSGSVANTLLRNGFKSEFLRPYEGPDGRSYCDQYQLNNEGELVAVPTRLANNADAALKWYEWQHIDKAVVDAARPLLGVVNGIRRRNLVYNIPNGMGTTVLLSQTMSEMTGAQVSMDGKRRGPSDAPVYGSKLLPLPIIHRDFEFSAREIEASRSGGQPLDMSAAVQAAQCVAEQIEDMTTGSDTSQFTYGGGTIYGMRNFPGRITGSIADPEGGTWTPDKFVKEVLDMMKQLRAARHRGPFVLYVSLDWAPFLGDDYSAAKGTETLKERLMKIDGLAEIEVCERLSGYGVSLVSQQLKTVRIVNAMDIITVQWSTDGGMSFHFKVMGIIIPEFRADHNGNCGIVDRVVA